MNGHYPQGIDYEWFAADLEGRIARFTTGGLGPIPSAVVEAEGVCEVAADEFAKLPRRGRARVFVGHPKSGDFSDFIRVSECGIYTYDCDDLCSGSSTRHYRLVSAPTSALSVTDLPLVARNAVSLAKLSEVVFGETTEISPDQLGAVVSAD
jgi:hypothetical protein